MKFPNEKLYYLVSVWAGVDPDASIAFHSREEMQAELPFYLKVIDYHPERDSIFWIVIDPLTGAIDSFPFTNEDIEEALMPKETPE